MDEDKIAKRVKEITKEINGRRMIFTDQDWPDDTGDQYSRVHTYSYYTYGNIPVRILSLPDFKWSVGEVLNYRTGQFEQNVDLMIAVEYDEGGIADEVRSKEEFYKLCDEYMANYTPQRIVEEEVMRERNEAWMRERMAKKKAEIDGK